MMQHITSLKNACLNIAQLIEFEYESKIFTEDLIFNDSNVNYDLIREQLNKFNTLVKDYSLMNKLSNDVEYFDLNNDPNVYLELK